MRTLDRNKTQFYYATWLGEGEIIDDEGRHTGEKVPTYSAWTPMSANVSSAKGRSEAELFGNDVQYDRVIVTDDVNCPIDENTVLAIDIAPNTREKVSDAPVFDYVVTRKSKSLNSVSYAVAKVKTK